MESDKYICVRETAGGAATVVIIENDNYRQPTRRPIKADSAIMNPRTQVIALKSGRDLQIFNIEMKSRMKACEMSEDVVFWKWVNVKTIGLVTATGVYHWTMEGAEAPTKVFDRHPNMNGAQIINYRVDSTGQWCCLIGIARVGNAISGTMQLYSIAKGVSQPLAGHAAAFTLFKPTTVSGPATELTLFAFASKDGASSRLHIIDVGATGTFPKKAVDIRYPVEAADDFPVAMQISKKYGVIYMVTKSGFIHVYDVESGTLIYMNRISAETIFATTENEATGGILGINRKGQVLSLTLDETKIIPHIAQGMSNYDLAIKFASRNNLPGAEGLFQQQFQRLFQAGQYQAAAQVAAASPQQILRTAQTIQMFASAPAQPGQQPPILQYFGVVMGRGKLNMIESLEIVKPVIMKGKRDTLEKWIRDDVLEFTAELGDAVKQMDSTLALSIYIRAQVHDKVVACFAELGQYDKIVPYSTKVGFTPDYMGILGSLLNSNPAAASNLAIYLGNAAGGPVIDIGKTVDLFMSRNMIKETTSFLLDVLKNNRPDEAGLQTRLLEINLRQAPRVADAIMSNDMFSHYDRAAIAVLCEKAGLYQRALEHYTEVTDIKRVIANAPQINPEFLVSYFGTKSAEVTLECLNTMLSTNPRKNIQVVVQVAQKYSAELKPEALIAMFESYKSSEGLFYYLGGIVNSTEDPEVVYKYIEAAAKIGKIKEVERIVTESNSYDPAKVKDFLKTANLSDQLPLIVVCDRFNFVADLTSFLYSQNMMKYIEIYVTKINSSRTPQVVGALLDVDCGEDFIKSLIASVGNIIPVAETVAEVEKRNRLKLLIPWLNSLMEAGTTDPAAHNALAKIRIDTNNDAEAFLQENQYYDSKVVGEYCEKRDPNLAFIAYTRGQCDQELVKVTNENGLFKQQARYLVQRQNETLFDSVLSPDNEYRRQLIDQIVQTALPESDNPDAVSTTVKAFMVAELPNELIELLEKIVLDSSKFSDNKNLQNLLILTAIKADREKVMDFINRLSNYDAPDIAEIAVGSELYEEAFTMYKKHNHNVPAIKVLLDHIASLDRAQEFAVRCDDPEVWSTLAEAQLNSNFVVDAIESYIKADDPSNYVGVIAAAEQEGHFEALVKFLKLAKTKYRESVIETELVYSYAKTNNLAELEEFISGPNVAVLQDVGDKCFDQGLYEAAKILYSTISNFGRLSATLLKLQQYQAAVDAARKANSTKVWKTVNAACVDAGEFRLAQMAGLAIIVEADELDELVTYYETRGHFAELMQLLEAGLGLERAHVALFTAAAVVYSKYNEERLMEHLKMYHGRMNIPKVARAAAAAHQWAELVFLQIASEEFDKAVQTMIEHPESAWDHGQLKETIVKVGSVDRHFKAIFFYLDYHPDLLVDLLNTLAPKLDHARVVSQLRKRDALLLIYPYLKSVQPANLKEVNDAVNELLIAEEDYEGLHHSIDTFDNIDAISLAMSLEKHELLEFRRIAAYIYTKNHRFGQSVALSKQDSLFKDAMETAANSKDQAVAEDLLRYFVEISNPECFAACLYTCYELLRPDVVLELAWRNKIMDMAMPFMIQVMREYISKVDTLEAAKAEAKKAAEGVVGGSQQADGSSGAVDTSGVGTSGQAAGYVDANGYVDPAYQQQQAIYQQQMYQQQAGGYYQADPNAAYQQGGQQGAYY